MVGCEQGPANDATTMYHCSFNVHDHRRRSMCETTHKQALAVYITAPNLLLERLFTINPDDIGASSCSVCMPKGLMQVIPEGTGRGGAAPANGQ